MALQNSKGVEPYIGLQNEKYLKSITWVLILIGISYSIFWFFWQKPWVSIYCLSNSAIGLWLLLYTQKNKNYQQASHILLGTGLLFILIINLLFEVKIPLLSVYFCIVPMTALILLGRPKTGIYVLLSLLGIIFSSFFSEYTSLKLPQSSQLILIINIVQTITIFMVLLFMVYLYDERNSKLISSLFIQNKVVRDAQSEVEKTQKYKDIFLASISHEIRTPMNAIKGISELLVESEFGKKQENELVTALNNSSIHLLNIINDLLDIDHVENRKINILKADFNLRDTIMFGTKMVQFAAVEKKIDLKIEIDPDVPEIISGDAQRLTQVLINILNNAVKFTDQGFVKLRVKNIIEKNIQHLEFTIKDTGIGIEKEAQKGLFERYKQSNDYISLKYGGTGLGLSISKSLVELMQGSIWFESVQNQGTTFVIRIPLVLPDKYQIKIGTVQA